MTKLPEHFMTCDVDGALYDTRQPKWSSSPPIRENYRYTHKEIASVADLKATLRAGPYAWPGGYPLYFVTATGGALSFDSVRENLREVMESIHDNYHDDWLVIACDINYEDTDLIDDHSGKPIDSAYGEDNDTPNLDAMQMDELEAYQQDESNPTQLREYAGVKACAMRSRLYGNIPSAKRLENMADIAYQKLPEEMKW